MIECLGNCFFQMNNQHEWNNTELTNRCKGASLQENLDWLTDFICIELDLFKDSGSITMTLGPAKCHQNNTFQLHRRSPFAHSVPDFRQLYRSPALASTSSRSSRRSSKDRVKPARIALKKGRGIRTERRGPCQSRIITQSGFSPARSRKSSAWVECDIDPWTQFRRQTNAIPNQLIERLSRSMEQDKVIDCYRCRNFSVTQKGVMNLGDLVRYRSRSNVSEATIFVDDIRNRTFSVGSNSQLRTTNLSDRYSVKLLGEENVGKSRLISQFMTSEFLTSSDDPVTVTDAHQESRVSILVDGEETELQFEKQNNPQTWFDEDIFTTTQAFVVAYSVTDRRSFQAAARIITSLRYFCNKQPEQCRGKGLTQKAVILVANKADLERCRVVSKDDGRSLARKVDAKFIETSAAVNHNVDELLVGIVSQIRLRMRLNNDTNDACRPKRMGGKARGLMSKLFHRCELKARSCDNLNII
ncbi:uncharacterized protein LOC143256885 isoform X2 [Tachypleus tridentatus]|uniref:uncharacterized protein LOC143256885 isoform X2 n=1 Tax=Tachypleus tridentatus TaxID=6853 RepID=UPI003FCFB93B